MANEGTKFEEDFQKSFKGLAGHLAVERLYDTMRMCRGVKNPCDYICYAYPNIFYFELKSYLGKSIPLEAVSSNQYEQLMRRSWLPGAISGLILNYRYLDKEKVAHSVCYFLPIVEYHALVTTGLKSVSLRHCEENCTRMEGRRVRTRHKYEVEKFMRELQRRFGCGA